MMFKVYIHETPNGKKYIGITSLKPETRWGGNGYKYTGQVFKYAINKYGWENIKHTIVADNLSKEEACKLEKELIKKYNTTDINYGYNMSIGGDCGAFGVVRSEETKNKISQAHKGLKVAPFSDEARKNMSEAHKGIKKQPMSIETKNKISLARKGKPNYKLRGRKFSEETLTKMSIASKNRVHIGHPISEKQKETIRAIQLKRSGKPVIQLSLDGLFIERYDGLHIASNKTKVGRKEIKRVCEGIYKQAGGYKWTYEV